MDLRDILDFLNVPNPQNLEELKLNITNEIQSISSENMVRRVRLCMSVNGGHFQHLLKFKFICR
jgi:hypothetical protein